jgi:low temperature requirement protein LtrA
MYFARFDDTVFDWALAGSAGERRRSFIFGYGHLPVLGGLAAVGVGVRVAIEQAVAHGPATRAAPLLGLAVAVYLAALTMIQSAAPRRLPVTVLAGRAIVTAALLVLAFLGRGLDALVLVVLATFAVMAQTLAEAAVDAARSGRDAPRVNLQPGPSRVLGHGDKHDAH